MDVLDRAWVTANEWEFLMSTFGEGFPGGFGPIDFQEVLRVGSALAYHAEAVGVDSTPVLEYIEVARRVASGTAKASELDDRARVGTMVTRIHMKRLARLDETDAEPAGSPAHNEEPMKLADAAAHLHESHGATYDVLARRARRKRNPMPTEWVAGIQCVRLSVARSELESKPPKGPKTD